MATRAPASLVLIPLVALALGACSSDEGEEGTTTETATNADVNATLADFSISLDPGSATAGDVTFGISNDGPSTHEFVVFQTDLAPDTLPVEDGLVPEDDPALTLAGEAEDISSGSQESLTLTLDAGSYVVICNIASHYESGMRAALTVS